MDGINTATDNFFTGPSRENEVRRDTGLGSWGLGMTASVWLRPTKTALRRAENPVTACQVVAKKRTDRLMRLIDIISKVNQRNST